MVKRARLKRKARSQSKAVASAPAPQWRLFGQPNVLEGEDAAAHEELLTRICAAIRPLDTIEEMYLFDVMSLEWEVLRWRRLKSTLIRARALKALEKHLSEKIGYNLYREHFTEDLADVLQNNLPEEQAEGVQTLARECARNESEAVDRVNEVLARISLELADILDGARARKAKELLQRYTQSEPDAVELVHELLTAEGASMDAFMANALVEKLEYIERIDRLAAIAESRRNASLCEIERRQAVLGATLRQNVQEIEDAEFKVIETTPAKGRNAD
jgi:hypothetical protein